MNKQQLKSLIREEIKKMIKESAFQPTMSVRDAETGKVGKVLDPDEDGFVVVQWDGETIPSYYKEEDAQKKLK